TTQHHPLSLHDALPISKNGAAQQYQALQAARARVALARKAFADTVVRAPFSGVVAERLVSAGDYVTKGMKVAVVVREPRYPRMRSEEHTSELQSRGHLV